MEGKSKSITWFGNIYQKLETMLQEADDVVSQNGVSYVENQVQKVGKSVKDFYANVIQDMVPPIRYPSKRVAEVVRYADSVKSSDKSASDLIDKQFPSWSDASDPSGNQTDHVPDEIHNTAPANANLDEMACSNKASSEIVHVLTSDNCDGDLEENPEKEALPDSNVLEFTLTVEDLSSRSLLCNKQVDRDKRSSSSGSGTELESPKNVNSFCESEEISDVSAALCVEKIEKVGINFGKSSLLSDSCVTCESPKINSSEAADNSSTLDSTLTHEDSIMEMRCCSQQYPQLVATQDVILPIVDLPKNGTQVLPDTYLEPSKFSDESHSDSINKHCESHSAATESSANQLDHEFNNLHCGDCAASPSMNLYEEVTSDKPSGQTGHHMEIENIDESLEKVNGKKKLSDSDVSKSELQSSQTVDEVCDSECILNITTCDSSNMPFSAIMPRRSIEDVGVDFCQNPAVSDTSFTCSLATDNISTVLRKLSSNNLLIGGQDDFNNDELDDSSLESIRLCDRTNLEDCHFTQENKQLYEVSRRVQNLRSLKKRIQDAFTSKKRLVREYELLAIWFGDADISFEKDRLPNFLPPAATTSESMKPQTDPTCDSEWEIL